ncbi:MAG: SapC family protein [Pseudomonadota bacterium]
MTVKRAIHPDDKPPASLKLPYLYHALAPLVPERHSAFHLAQKRHYGFAAKANAIPLTMDEFPVAQRHYPIVITGDTEPMPVALMGTEKGINPQVDADGNWAADKYIPAYLRRYPFMLIKEKQDSDNMVLCADVTSVQFSERKTDGAALFEEGKGSEVMDEAVEFARRFEGALSRTRAAMTEFKSHDLIEDSSVTISRGEKRVRLEGFKMLSEERMRNLPDETLAAMAKRGLIHILAAHHISLSGFSGFAKG